jgi:hypothetical protein
MLSETDAACVAIASALCLINEKIDAGSKSGTKTTIHTRKSHDRLNVGVSRKTKFFFVRFDCPLFDGTLKKVTPTIAK